MLMSKRFINQVIPKKSWRKLDCNSKLTWFFMWMNCDVSGVYTIDEDLFEFENGFEFDLKLVESNFSDHVEILDDKILIIDFIKINYGTKLRPDYNPHKPLFRKIEENNLIISILSQACFKLVEEDEEEEEDEDGDGDGVFFPDSENLKNNLNQDCAVHLATHDYFLDFNAESAYLESIIRSIKKSMSAKKKTQGFPVASVSKPELLEGFKFLIDNLDEWTRVNNFSMKYISNNFQKVSNGIKQKAKTEKPKESFDTSKIALAESQSDL